MKTEIKLTKFKGRCISSYDTFLYVNNDGMVTLKLSMIRLRSWLKAFQLKKEALILHKKYTNQNLYNFSLFANFCKRYPQIDWDTALTVKSSNDNEFTVYCDYPINFNQLQEKIRKFCNIPAYKFHLCTDLDYYTKLLDEKILEYKIKKIGIAVGDNAVVLTNGKYLVSKYSDIRHLKFIVASNLAEFLSFSNNKELEKEINILWENSPEFMYGNYIRSKKGTPLFYPCAKSNAKHILIKMRTEMKDPYGGIYPIDKNIYHEFNAPYIFNIIENGIKLQYDEESI